MGLFSDNLFGFDMNFDGKLDIVDDLLFLEEMDDYDRINKRGIYAEDESDDDGDEDF